jgi:hypothetical protein
MSSFKKIVVFFAPCLSLILCSCASQRIETNTQPPNEVAALEETQPQQCTDIRVNSGWFVEKNGYCYFDKQAAINGFQNQLSSEGKRFKNQDLEQNAAQQKKSSSELDFCFGPLIPDSDWYVACNDCMCCIVIKGKLYCMSDNNVAATVMAR